LSAWNFAPVTALSGSVTLASGNIAGRKHSMANAENPLYRSRRNRWIAGVCGGLAEWLGWNPTLVRLLYVVVSVVSAAFPGIIVYIVLWAVMPLRQD
jgi:phage shock protein PspC (stress-responsive transcriptional regulator)